MHRNVYTFAFYLLLPLYFARLCWKGAYNREYFFRWPERLGISKDSPTKNKPLIWVHAVSVGEVNASMPLLRRLIAEYPNIEILVTTTTPTGSKLLLERLGGTVKHQYLPVDLPLCIKHFLDHWQPKALILLETEIWPNLINLCKQKGIKTALVNARLSEKSKSNYLKYNSLIKESIDSLDLILAQYESDRLRFNEISQIKKIDICGNLKFDQDIPSELNEISLNIRKDWSINGKVRPTLIASSTHEGEEDIVLDAFEKILKVRPESLLVLVPRHLERFERVKGILQESKIPFVSRSMREDVSKDTKILLGDTIGELNFLYSLADVAFIGGSLIDHGGQNLLEPSAQSLALLSGPSLRNFSDISEQLIQNNALAVVHDAEELCNRYLLLIEDESTCNAIGAKAYEVFMKNRGALDAILNKLKPLISNVI
ncbi:MAG: 3-deoxy-D-manno-octulosonic acid transferase [Gammaproteobacteria bacterium]|nr:3-deoxy-D-manno-octulosonic acid transferase [Gammaproteobacteria bacterium]